MLLAVTIGGLMIGLEIGGNDGWTEPLVVAMFIVVLVGLVVFILGRAARRRADDPAAPVLATGWC